MKEIASQPKANVALKCWRSFARCSNHGDNSPGGGSSIGVRGFGTINNNDPFVNYRRSPHFQTVLNGINPTHSIDDG
jgi:hypothetical protein